MMMNQVVALVVVVVTVVVIEEFVKEGPISAIERAVIRGESEKVVMSGVEVERGRDGGGLIGDGVQLWEVH